MIYGKDGIDEFQNDQTMIMNHLRIILFFFLPNYNYKSYYYKIVTPLMDWKNKPHQIFNKVKLQMFSKGI